MPPHSAFSEVPFLTLAVQNIGKMKSMDADCLASIWAIFTKCKTSIEQGRRLENFAWRLWWEAEFGPGPKWSDSESSGSETETESLLEAGNRTARGDTPPGLEQEDMAGGEDRSTGSSAPGGEDEKRTFSRTAEYHTTDQSVRPPHPKPARTPFPSDPSPGRPGGATITPALDVAASQGDRSSSVLDPPVSATTEFCIQDTDFDSAPRNISKSRSAPTATTNGRGRPVSVGGRPTSLPAPTGHHSIFQARPQGQMTAKSVQRMLSTILPQDLKSDARLNAPKQQVAGQGSGSVASAEPETAPAVATASGNPPDEIVEEGDRFLSCGPADSGFVEMPGVERCQRPVIPSPAQAGVGAEAEEGVLAGGLTSAVGDDSKRSPAAPPPGRSGISPNDVSSNPTASSSKATTTTQQQQPALKSSVKTPSSRRPSDRSDRSVRLSAPSSQAMSRPPSGPHPAKVGRPASIRRDSSSLAMATLKRNRSDRSVRITSPRDDTPPPPAAAPRRTEASVASGSGSNTTNKASISSHARRNSSSSRRSVTSNPSPVADAQPASEPRSVIKGFEPGRRIQQPGPPTAEEVAAPTKRKTFYLKGDDTDSDGDDTSPPPRPGLAQRRPSPKRVGRGDAGAQQVVTLKPRQVKPQQVKDDDDDEVTEDDDASSGWGSDESYSSSKSAELEAAEEERKRALFAKRPTRSAVELQAGSGRTGLLSQLFNPPRVSSEELNKLHPSLRKSAVALIQQHDLHPMSGISRGQPAIQHRPAVAGLRQSKSAVAVPVATNVEAFYGESMQQPKRLGGAPGDVEMESSSGEEDDDESEPPPPSSSQNQLYKSFLTRLERFQAQGAMTAMMSPRAVRRNMLATELTESIRRNLLWERHTRIGGTAWDPVLTRRNQAGAQPSSQPQLPSQGQRESSSSQGQPRTLTNPELHAGRQAGAQAQARQAVNEPARAKAKARSQSSANLAPIRSTADLRAMNYFPSNYNECGW